MEKSRLRALLPFTLSLVLLAADQITKAWVVATIPQGTVGHSFLSDFLWICHVRNSAIGFSIGDGLPETAKRILFIALPLVVMVVLVIHMIRSGELRVFQRWMVAGIVGGGAGNLLDRMFRPEWVVDFISIKFYGLFGFERWPTFNVADASIVVSGILLMASLLFFDKGKSMDAMHDAREVPHE
jgi:signal peptidase II